MRVSFQSPVYCLRFLHNTAYWGLLLRDLGSIKALTFTLQWPTGARLLLENIHICETDNIHLYFYFLTFLSIRDFEQQSVSLLLLILSNAKFLVSEMSNCSQMMALIKHPKFIPIQWGQPELQAARRPRIGNANGKESILIRYKKNSKASLLPQDWSSTAEGHTKMIPSWLIVPVSQSSDDGFSQPWKSLPPDMILNFLHFKIKGKRAKPGDYDHWNTIDVWLNLIAATY